MVLKMKLKLIPAALAAIIATPALPDTYTVYGAPPCGAVISHWQKGNEALQIADENWTLGFISGAGYEGTVKHHYDYEGIVLFLRQYCQSHPLDDSGDVVKALLKTKEPE
jgi:hypothetical protein